MEYALETQFYLFVPEEEIGAVRLDPWPTHCSWPRRIPPQFTASVNAANNCRPLVIKLRTRNAWKRRTTFKNIMCSSVGRLLIEIESY